MTDDEFKEFVKDSAMDRITLSMWRRNILFIA
jgi:epoxyqueuosine reductase QueG